MGFVYTHEPNQEAFPNIEEKLRLRGSAKKFGTPENLTEELSHKLEKSAASAAGALGTPEK